MYSKIQRIAYDDNGLGKPVTEDILDQIHKDAKVEVKGFLKKHGMNLLMK